MLRLLALVLLVAGCAPRAVPRTVPPAAPPASSTPAAVTAPPSRVPDEAFTLPSRGLGEDRRIAVYLPAAYRAEPARSFPVLYMPDGGVDEDFPHVADAVDALIAEGAIPPTLVVGVANTERRRDMTGPTDVESDRRIAPRVGGSAAFRAFFRDELMPEVRRRYRITDEAGIVGESLAGLFVVETLFAEPGLFDAYVALSPSLWWNGGRLTRGAPAWLAAHPDVRARLFLAHAADDNLPPGVDTLAAALRAGAPRGLVWTFEPRPDLTHATIYRGLERRALAWALGRP